MWRTRTAATTCSHGSLTRASPGPTSRPLHRGQRPCRAWARSASRRTSSRRRSGSAETIWLYVVFNCATNARTAHDPGSRGSGWKPVARVESFHATPATILGGETKDEIGRWRGGKVSTRSERHTLSGSIEVDLPIRESPRMPAERSRFGTATFNSPHLVGEATPRGVPSRPLRVASARPSRRALSAVLPRDGCQGPRRVCGDSSDDQAGDGAMHAALESVAVLRRDAKPRRRPQRVVGRTAGAARLCERFRQLGCRYCGAFPEDCTYTHADCAREPSAVIRRHHHSDRSLCRWGFHSAGGTKDRRRSLCNRCESGCRPPQQDDSGSRDRSQESCSRAPRGGGRTPRARCRAGSEPLPIRSEAGGSDRVHVGSHSEV